LRGGKCFEDLDVLELLFGGLRVRSGNNAGEKMRMINRIFNSLTLRLCAFAGENFPAKAQRRKEN